MIHQQIEIEACIKACMDCHVLSATTAVSCLEKGGEHAEPGHIKMLLDCAEICQTSANFMLRRSPRHDLTCKACAEICIKCAEDCERMGDDLQMKACAAACRACARACQMAGSVESPA